MLVRFDFSDLPPGSNIVAAELSFYTLDRTNTRPLTAHMYRLRRDWSETEATGNLARAGQPWQGPMASGEGDREQTPFASLELAASGWSSMDITGLANEWNANPLANFGILMSGESDGSVQYSLTSRDWNLDQNLRPHLHLRYQVLPPTTPTPTPTPEPLTRVWLPRLLRDLQPSAVTSFAPASAPADVLPVVWRLSRLPSWRRG